MTTISTKNVLLGVTGSIAAYKAYEIASTLTKEGINVRVVVTQSAQHLVGSATFEGLTGNRVITGMFDPLQNADIEHIAVSTGADLFIVAPASANMLGKLANGIADDWLSTALLVTQAPILFAPAMNTNMYGHPAVKQNIEMLTQRGAHFVGPGTGVLACKTVGAGRMSEPQEVVDVARALLFSRNDLTGKRVLITTGANHEPIDPVRYIGNRSSGKMGHAVAKAALMRGADVTVITGPADVQPPCGSKIIQVQTALEMQDAVLEHFEGADVIIGAAAVADYRVDNPPTEKQKRGGSGVMLELIENPDIIAAVGTRKKSHQCVVGFAAETNDLIENAKSKLSKKNLDIIVANTVGVSNSGFGAETADARFLFSDGSIEEHPVLQKCELADLLMSRIVGLLDKVGN